MSELGDQIRGLHAVGVGPADIAHRLHIAHSTVGYHLRRTISANEDATPTGQPGRRAHESGKLPIRAAVASLLERGVPRVEIARRLGVAKSTVSYHAKTLGHEVDGRYARRFEWTLVQRYYDEGHSVRDCCRAFGFSAWTWSQAARRGSVVPRPSFKPLEEIFAVGTPRGRGHLKRRLLSAGLKENRCERCGLDSWLDEPLSISLHHINGVRDDNRVENLQLLCPNCHSQTDTFAGRNGRGAAEVTGGDQVSDGDRNEARDSRPPPG